MARQSSDQSDLRAALNIKTDQLAKEREAVAREVHLLLMKWVQSTPAGCA